MKRAIFLGMALVLAVTLAGCGGDERTPTTIVGQILSDSAADGDVGFDSITYTISHANTAGNVIFGTDASGVEYQAFLDFPLNGSNGGSIIPLSAVIVAADIEVFVSSMRFATTVPTRLDLVTYPSTGPTSADFILSSTPPATYRTLSFLSSDQGNFVRIDVTSLMQEAQRQGLTNFQVRFLLDFVSGASGLVTLADAGSATAPLLTVEYR